MTAIMRVQIIKGIFREPLLINESINERLFVIKPIVSLCGLSLIEANCQFRAVRKVSTAVIGFLAA